jgi:tripartite-type tricarboxylate transporter receptor subunit TctC
MGNEVLLARGLQRRSVLALGAASCLAPAAVLAQGGAGHYPDQPIRIIVPFAAGGPTDVLARSIAMRLTEQWGQPVLVDNRAGAGGNIGAEAAAHASPDGYTLLLATAGILAVNPNLGKVRFDPLKDFVPVSLTANLTSLLGVHPGLKVKTAKELIALAKARPGQLNYGSAGNGSASHLAMERFKRAAGIDIRHVPYKGAAPAVNDLIAGNVQVMLIGLPTIMPQVAAGRVVPLGVSSLKPSPLAPGLPTIADAAGLPGFEVTNWLGILAPAGTPGAIVTKLNAEIVAILTRADVSEQLHKSGFEPLTSTPEHFASYLESELALWSKVVKDAGIKID